MSRRRNRPRMSASARLLGDLAEAEKGHENVAARLTDKILSPNVRAEEDKTRRRVFVLQYVQPGLAGLMDGSVSTLAPLFAAAFATHHNWQTFLVGLAASIGAGISMGFAEALSDDGSLTGRGSPWLRGLTCGIMTTLGGLGHTMPYLVPDTWAERVLDRDRNRGARGVLRIMGDRLHSRALHGHAVPAGGVPDRARRRHRARSRHTDRGGLRSCSNEKRHCRADYLSIAITSIPSRTRTSAVSRKSSRRISTAQIRISRWSTATASSSKQPSRSRSGISSRTMSKFA